MAHVKRQRSKAYPRIPVNEAVEVLHGIRSAIGTGPYSRDALAESMGLSPKSGHANSKTAALVHYGFLNRSGSNYEMTEMADSVLHPTSALEPREAVAEAVQNPTLFGALFERFGGKSLPTMLANLLAREYGISAKQSEDVAAIFRRSVEYAGLLRHGILHRLLDVVEAAESGVANDDTEADHTTTGSVVAFAPSPHGSVGVDSFNIPLRGGSVASLTIPKGVSRSDIERIKKWIDLMEDVLVEED